MPNDIDKVLFFNLPDLLQRNIGDIDIKSINSDEGIQAGALHLIKITTNKTKHALHSYAASKC